MSANSFRLDSACLPLRRVATLEQNILDGVRDLFLVLAPDGHVLHASQMCFALTTLIPEHIIGNYITTFMHYDDLPVFLMQFNACLISGKSWRFHHRLRRADDTFAVFESTFNPFFDTSSTQSAEYFGLHKCVMTIRPYSSPSMVLMDSYLDHYTTNTLLVEQLKLLRAEAEIADEEDEGEKEVVQETNVYLPSIAKTNNKVHLNTKSRHPSDGYLRQAIENSALDSNGDPHDGVVPKVEKTPGSGDIGIQITASRLETIKKTGSWTTKPCQIRKRKNAKPREYLCIECGTKESPEWRTGARGRKTLCNACGLRWAKTSKHEVLECAATILDCASQPLECTN